MSTIAKIVGGVAVDIRVSQEFTPPEGETWIDCPWWVQPRSLYANGVWSKPDGSEYTLSDYARPVTKLTLKRRVTSQEWAAIMAAISSNADTLENWNLATEIDPAHPETAAMIAALTGAGLLTTPIHVIFAP